MLFNSAHFLGFFPLVTLLVFLLPRSAQVPFLLLAGCYFYAAFIPKFLLILFLLIGFDYFAAFWIEESRGRKKKWALAASLAANIGLLGIFKYYGFFTENIAAGLRALGLGLSFPELHLILPLGLSFHTFQSMAYTIEIYRGNYKPERSFLTYALYVLFYPQLVAGPIERPQHLLPQLRKQIKFSPKNLGAGLELMCWGFFKKVFVADRLAAFVDVAFAPGSSVNGLPLLLGVYFFAFQIYFDFSGYTDIARGAARVMGIDLMRNFDSPYSAENVPDFWRRWHISLSTWFRDYLYIPLGGSRKGLLRGLANILIVFLVSGLWHGANWTFVAWGALHGLYVVSSTLTQRLRWRTKFFLVRWWRVFVTFHLVCFAWIFFRAESIEQAFTIIRGLGALESYKSFSFASRSDLMSLLAVAKQIFFDDRLRTGLLALLVYCFVRSLRLGLQVPRTGRKAFLGEVLYRPAFSAALVCLILLGGVLLSESTFIYFQF